MQWKDGQFRNKLKARSWALLSRSKESWANTSTPQRQASHTITSSTLKLQLNFRPWSKVKFVEPLPLKRQQLRANTRIYEVRKGRNSFLTDRLGSSTLKISRSPILLSTSKAQLSNRLLCLSYCSPVPRPDHFHLPRQPVQYSHYLKLVTSRLSQLWAGWEVSVANARLSKPSKLASREVLKSV